MEGEKGKVDRLNESKGKFCQRCSPTRKKRERYEAGSRVDGRKRTARERDEGNGTG